MTDKILVMVTCRSQAEAKKIVRECGERCSAVDLPVERED